MEDYDASRFLLLGFDPNEHIVGVAFLQKGVAQAFDMQADSRGQVMASNPFPHAYTFAFVGENANASCYRCASRLSQLLYDYYWAGGGTPPLATYSPPGAGLGPAVTNIRFCDAPCSSSGAHQLFTFPEATKKIFARWDYSGMQPGTQYTREWFSRGQSWVRYQCTWQGPASGSKEVTLTELGGLRSGAWEIVIAVGGKEVARASFQVAGSFDFWDPAGSKTCPDS